MFQDRRGVGVAAEGGLDVTPRSIMKLQDFLIVRLQRRGVSTRAIGKVIGVHQSTVVRRLQTIPPRVKERYAKLEIRGIL
jgi:transposase-like protein